MTSPWSCAVILLDDVVDSQQQDVVARWTGEFDLAASHRRTGTGSFVSLTAGGADRRWASAS